MNYVRKFGFHQQKNGIISINFHINKIIKLYLETPRYFDFFLVILEALFAFGRMSLTFSSDTDPIFL